MRPAGRSETDSLYFDYPYFDAPERADVEGKTPVAIVGAGPVGMVAALGLAQRGISSILFDNKSTFNDGSRAICVARASFHLLERIGAVEPFLEKSLGWTMGRSFYRGQQILEFEMPDSTSEKYRPMYNIQQQFIEKFLWEAVAKEPLIETRWQSTVDAVVDHQDGFARLAVTDPNGSYEIDATWVLAADGARSSIRKMRGLRLNGENYEGRYVIADVQMDHDYPTIRRALFDPDCRRGGTVLVHKQPDNIWRIDYQLGDDEDEAAAIQEDTVRTSVQAVLDDIGHKGDWELEWWSIYSANTLALDDYRDGRVFFIGDSAHIVPIFGVRGLNNGLADAENIAWKLGMVLNGEASEDLLNSYTPERRGATLDVFANASKSARFMTPPTKGWEVMRDAALSLALREPFAGNLANPRQMTPYTYADSPVVMADDAGFSSGPVPGSALPNAQHGEGFLSDYLGPDFTLILCDPRFEITSQNVKTLVLDPNCDAAQMLGLSEHGAYLIRPDGHISARFYSATAETIETAIKHSIQGAAQ